MRLTLNVLRCPDAAVPESRSSGGGDISIGRGLENDWVLEDPERVLSKRHCVLEFRGGYWQVRDTSTNGTFLNGAAEPIGREMVAPISDGDRLRFGSYEVELRVSAADGAATGQGWGEAAIGGRGGAGRPASDPFGDPFAPAGHAGGLPGTASGLPDDWDPLADVAAPMPDHAPATSDAFLVPRVTPLPPTGGAAIPTDWNPMAPDPAPRGGAGAVLAGGGSGGLPDDWDPLADLAGPTAAPPQPQAPPAGLAPPPPSAPPAGFAHQPPPAPMGFAHQPPAAPASFAPTQPAAMPAEEIPPFALPEAEPERPAFVPAQPAHADPFAEDGVPSRLIPEVVQPPAGTGLPPAAPATAPGFPPMVPAAAPGFPPAAPMPTAAFPSAAPPAPPPAPRAPVAPPAAAALDPAMAVAALLRGAGINPGALHGAAAEQPLVVLEQAGAALRAAIAGLRALLIARADVKREFRIEQTMLRAVGNNPVKFAATEEAAIAALLVGGAHGARAVADTVGDLTAHEVATLAATQAAARALLDRLAPEVVEQADTGGGGGLFGGGREKRLWEAYRRLHTKVTEQFEDDFDSVFGKEFARAYEQAVAAGDGGRR